MPELYFVNENKKINVEDGMNLRVVSNDNGVGVYSNIFKKLFNCRGKGMCGTCLVRIEGEKIESPNEIESKKLKKKLPKDPNLRLACQLTISSDLKIYTL
ncbi:MAG: (2Fe-2S)-binding protein [Flavobacteriaceae bacterium]|nr:(2Fe-2S)-binding protein [Flavobacteriaceae bacterium]